MAELYLTPAVLQPGLLFWGLKMLMKKLLLFVLFISSATLVGCGSAASETGAVTGEDTEEEFLTDEEEAGEGEGEGGGRRTKKRGGTDDFE